MRPEATFAKWIFRKKSPPDTTFGKRVDQTVWRVAFLEGKGHSESDFMDRTIPEDAVSPRPLSTKT